MSDTQRRLLGEILKQAHSTDGGLAVFDLDSTLFQVNPRTLKIMHLMAEEPGLKAEHPELSNKLSSITELKDTYHVKTQLEYLGITDLPDSIYKKMFKFWQSKFFSDDHLVEDTPYPGAKDFVDEVVRAGLDLAYLTGRDTLRMEKGTLASLEKWGFPVPPDATLEMKPTSQLGDPEFKADYFDSIDVPHSKIWFFENEPSNIELVHGRFPEINIVYFESVHSGKSEEPPDYIPRIKSFEFSHEHEE